VEAIASDLLLQKDPGYDEQAVSIHSCLIREACSKMLDCRRNPEHYA
jgi:hypothetical protein